MLHDEPDRIYTVRRDSAFNSLFEMHCALRPRLCAERAETFNSLFEMQSHRFLARVLARLLLSFNSLFEMQDKRRRISGGEARPSFNSLFEMPLSAFAAAWKDVTFQFSI